MKDNFEYLIGIDGGGTKTNVLILKASHSLDEIYASHTGAACALGAGREKSWKAILEAITQAFATKDQGLPPLAKCALALGLSGANNKDWAEEFLLKNPGFHHLSLYTDALTSLWGAYPNGVGIIIALGTGSVGLRRNFDGTLMTVSGWGFPSGDEASGAWLGLKVASHIQKVFDHREPQNELFRDCTRELGWGDSEQFLKWLGEASQNEFATLAPYVFRALKRDDPFAHKLLNHTLFEMKKMLDALAPDQNEEFALCGSIGTLLIEHLDEQTKKRHRHALASSAEGALNLLKSEVS